MGESRSRRIAQVGAALALVSTLAAGAAPGQEAEQEIGGSVARVNGRCPTVTFVVGTTRARRDASPRVRGSRSRV